MLPAQVFGPFSTNPGTYAFVVPALRKLREGRGTLSRDAANKCPFSKAGPAAEIKSLGHAARTVVSLTEIGIGP